jgi:hypothetical protein
MRINTRFLRGLILATQIAACLLPISARCGQTAPHPPSHSQTSLRKFLQAYDSEGDPNPDKTTYYFAAFVDLQDDGTQDVIVYFTESNSWCGTGGCTTLILVPTGESYRVVSKIVTTRPPIRVLDTKSHGWHDLGVRAQWDGVPAYEAKLSFNGKSYPFSTSSNRSQRLGEQVPGKVVVPSDAHGAPLF